MMMFWVLSPLCDLKDLDGSDSEAADPTETTRCPGPGGDTKVLIRC